MNSFVRFIFLVLVAGILLNLTIVGLANVSSERKRDADLRAEREQFQSLIDHVKGRLRRADLAVEWQTLDASEKVLETSLLVRQYYRTTKDELKPMPMVRVKVPGDRVQVDALLVEFDTLFNDPRGNLEMFRGTREPTQLVYFDKVYMEGQPEKERFTFLPEDQVPALTRLHPLLAEDVGLVRPTMPSIYEMEVWQRLWSAIRLPRQRPAGLTVTHLPPVVREVRRGRVYTAWAGPDGVTIEDQTGTGQLTEMREEMERQEKADTRKD